MIIIFFAVFIIVFTNSLIHKCFNIIKKTRGSTKMIFQHFWVLFIAVTMVNYFIFKFRSIKHIKENPELEKGYKTLLRGYLFWMNMPWIVMGIGSTIGGVPSIDHFFRPQDKNPYVIAWFGSVFILWIAGTYWVFFRGGAEMLIKYPGALNKTTSSPKMIKMIWLLCLLGGIFAVVLMWK